MEDDLMEDDSNGRQTHYKTTSIVDDLNGIQPKWIWKMKDDLIFIPKPNEHSFYKLLM